MVAASLVQRHSVRGLGLFELRRSGRTIRTVIPLKRSECSRIAMLSCRRTSCSLGESGMVMASTHNAFIRSEMRAEVPTEKPFYSLAVITSQLW
jgi:hypothetical protein